MEGECMVSYHHLSMYYFTLLQKLEFMYQYRHFCMLVDPIILLIPGVHLENCECPLCPSKFIPLITPCDHNLGEGPEDA